jgi:thiamine-phosphate pyrophosphorylase
MQNCQLYIISPETIIIDEFKVQLREAIAGGEVAVFQLRLKNVADEFIIQAAKELLPICHEYGVQFILNDRPDIAAKVGADGVHIGEDQDGTLEQARKIMGKKIIGVSCYGSVDRAMDMAENGADYVAFGAFYPTTTKAPKARPDAEILTWWVTNSTVPCVAIGGINAGNCVPIVKAGADFIAVVSAIWGHKDGATEAVKELSAAIANSL